MSVLGKTKIGVSATSLALILAMTFAPAAFAADGDGAPPDATPVASVTADPATDQAPAQSSESEAPSEEAPVAPVTEAPVVTEPEAPAVQPIIDSSARKSNTEESKKVFVCKYVGTPGVDERLQTGQNPISVSVNAIQHNEWDGTIPGYFSDAHDRSYVLAYNTGQAEPSVSDCPTVVVPPAVKPCVNSGSLTWTRDAHLSTATVTLKSGFTSCDVSLNSYETEGATWQTSGTQSFVDHATAHLTTENPTATLTVKVQGCFQQQDLYTGTMRYDGTDGALPLYPTSSTPAGLIDHWNGATDCTPPPVTAEVCTAKNSYLVTNQNEQGFNSLPTGSPYADTRPGGSGEYVSGALHTVTTSGAAKFQTARAVDIPATEYDGPLSMNFQFISGYIAPGINVVIDAENNGSNDVTFTAEPNVAGYLTYWTNTPGYLPASLGGQGGPFAGTMDDLVAVWPNAHIKVEKLSQGSGVVTDGNVISWSTPCNTYTYDYVAPPVETLTPVGPTYTESTECGVEGTYGIAGATLDGEPSTTTDPETGVVTTLSSYSSDQGGYNVVDTTTADGIRTVQFTFVQIGEATIAAPGEGDEYVIVTIDGVNYAQWTHTFLRVTVCPTIIATPPAPVVVAPTCSADGSLPTLVDGENYTAAYNRPFDGPGAYKAVYTVTGLNEFATGKSVSYDLTVAGKTGDCPTTTVPAGNTTPTPPKLAYTGAEIAGPIGLALALLSAGFILLIVKKRDAVLGLVRRVARRPIAE